MQCYLAPPPTKNLDMLLANSYPKELTGLDAKKLNVADMKHLTYNKYAIGLNIISLLSIENFFL